MSATRPDGESYREQMAVARELREMVADQLHDLVVERESMGSYTELVEKVQQLGLVGREIAQARGRQRQALEMGLASREHVAAEREALMLLRQSAMTLAAACGAWVTQMDFNERMRHVTPVNGRRRRAGDEDI